MQTLSRQLWEVLQAVWPGTLTKCTGFEEEPVTERPLGLGERHNRVKSKRWARYSRMEKLVKHNERIMG